MQLLFIYNANSGNTNAVFDSLHKILSPGSYDCKICELTFGIFGEKAEWKRFRKESGFDMVFLHKDEYTKQYRSKWLPRFDYPVVLTTEDGQIEVLITKEDLEGLKDSSELIELVKSRSIRD